MNKFFPALKIMNAKSNEPRLLVCPDHNQDTFFTWCTCNSSDKDEDQTECEKCKRWYHNGCMGVSKVVCKGCN